MVDLYHQFKEIEAWHTLVHVCRKWRNIVFGSPRRLDLRLYCTEKTPVRKTLEVWPLLPIVVYGFGYEKWGVDNSRCGPRAKRSHMSLEPRQYAKFSIRKSLSSNAAAIPGTHRPAYEAHRRCGRSCFVFGWICNTTTGTHPAWHHISGITEATFVRHQTLFVFIFIQFLNPDSSRLRQSSVASLW